MVERYLKKHLLVLWIENPTTRGILGQQSRGPESSSFVVIGSTMHAVL